MMLFENFLMKLFYKKRDEIKNSYSRVLPLNEALTDRWEKAKYCNFGKGSSVYDSAIIFGNVTVGENTWIGPFTILDGSGKLSIGSYCSISAGVQIYTHDSVKWAVSGGVEKYEYAEVKIGNNCYIGPNSIIAKGVTIGDGCIIGANSFVNKSFASGKKVAGNPAKELE
ncbi:MAG: acyltransferase [Saprospiraceae bacterium]|nr:acyltransferase [Saprospiraceae bacterium]